jgi:hypothetical protein
MAMLAGRIAAQEASVPHVRSSDPRLAELIDQATRGSVTFRRLVDTVQASHGIVYVEPGMCGHGVRACLKMWMQVSGASRFVRIAITPSPRPCDVEVMGAIGHELQHAIEVLNEPGIRDGVTMFSYLERIAPNDQRRFETTAAINAGDRVYDELRASSRVTPQGARLGCMSPDGSVCRGRRATAICC